MSGFSVVVDPVDARRHEILASLAEAGQQAIIENPDATGVQALFDDLPPLDLAVIAVTQPTDAPLFLISRLRLVFPGCLILAIDHVDSEASVAWAFSAGAHDVVRMPFRKAEFDARMARRLMWIAPKSARSGNDADPLIAKLDLTPAEQRVLRVLVSHMGRIVTRDELSQHLYGRDWDYQDRRFDVHIGRIRRKIRDTFKGLYAIQTIRSAGYMFEVKQPD
ncbi:response regulator transcription factor [Phaeobacter sp. 22II1-1F12B]|uniref:response regulator transcription factor n=1 Tax=Phaeobacter sp. 22II1-1F12B TaxID=1317111 RepID=UPI000B521FDC|nr:response regulator transcription factor [Phaeobacter sp. 22II1-1F12B]